MTIFKHPWILLPMILLVPVVLQRVVIDQVEEQHASSSQLEFKDQNFSIDCCKAYLKHGSDPAVFGKLILVIPSPVGPSNMINFGTSQLQQMYTLVRKNQ